MLEINYIGCNDTIIIEHLLSFTPFNLLAKIEPATFINVDMMFLC